MIDCEDVRLSAYSLLSGCCQAVVWGVSSAGVKQGAGVKDVNFNSAAQPNQCLSLSLYLSIHLSLSVYLSVCLSLYVTVCCVGGLGVRLPLCFRSLKMATPMSVLEGHTFYQEPLRVPQQYLRVPSHKLYPVKNSRNWIHLQALPFHLPHHSWRTYPLPVSPKTKLVSFKIPESNQVPNQN